MKRASMSCAMLWLAGASFAADAPVPSADAPALRQRAYAWTGLYVGVNAGWGWGREDSRVNFIGALTGGTTTPFGLGATELSGTTVAGAADPSGAVAGGQAGFNWQAGALVLGVEVDGQWSGQQASLAASCDRAACTAGQSPQIRSFATARARVGYAFDNVMAYVTGGGAIVNVLDNLTMTVAGVNGNFLALSTTALGWAAGAGVEAALWSNWSARLEYLFIGFINGRATTAIPGSLGAGTASEAFGYQDNILRVGLNYRFGPERGNALLTPPRAAHASAAAPKVEIGDARPAPSRAARHLPSPPPGVAQGMAQGDADEAEQPSVAAPAAGGIELPRVAGIDDPPDARPRRSRPARTAADASPDKDESRRLKRVMDICRGC